MSTYHNKTLRATALVARMLLGLFFIVTAIAKMFDMDRFELYIYSYNLLPLNVSLVLARIVVICEILVGIGLIANIWRRFVDTCTLLMLVGFTLFLGYAALIGRTDDCHCAGSLLEFNPLQSILKNAILILIFLFSLGANPWTLKHKWYLLAAAILVIVAVPTVVMIVSCPDNWLFGEGEEIYNKPELDKAIAPQGCLGTLHINEGTKLVAFLTPGCPYCRMSVEKFTHIYRRNGLDSNKFIYIIPMTEAEDSLYRADTSAHPLPSIDTASYIHTAYIIPRITWAKITYGDRPKILLLKDGEVIDSYHYRNINEKAIVAHLSSSPTTRL